MFILLHIQRAYITSPESLSTEQKSFLYSSLLEVKNLKEYFTSEKEILTFTKVYLIALPQSMYHFPRTSLRGTSIFYSSLLEAK